MKRIYLGRGLGILVLAIAVAGCGYETGTASSSATVAAAEAGEGEVKKGGKADDWTSADDPALFAGALEYREAELPRQGEAATIPWAGSYWPVAEDSINKRWAGPGEPSPAEKFGTAFGIANLEDKVSQYHGIDGQSSRTKCTLDGDCKNELGERCAKRRGKDEGFCIPTWWGLCHAWAPGAIMTWSVTHSTVLAGNAL